MGLNKLKILEKPSSPTQPSLRRLVDRVKLSSTASKNSDHVAEKRCGADAQHDGSECDHDENCEPVLRAPQRLPSAAAPPKGGLLFDTPADRALAERQRESVRFIACRFGSHLLSRSSAPVSLTSTVMPVHLNEPRSFLQRLTDDLVYADYFLSAAAACKNDPKQRLSLIAGFLVSSLHCSANMAKCFNPHIGETYQATYGSESCPSKVYLEQTRHHPPVSHFVALPADNGTLLRHQDVFLCLFLLRKQFLCFVLFSFLLHRCMNSIVAQCLIQRIQTNNVCILVGCVHHHKS